ncbi:MAG: A/G-specific adenine glycosylase [Eubacterium sp.]|nr:A/G-specific adenine glycosylase [Eubacterium sp.]
MADGTDRQTVERVSALVRPLLDWYSKNKRSLPWREAPSPYHVWISEIMLQQTRIEAVMGYYERFLERLPSVRELAEVEDDELMKLWEGLGYYSRARNLKKAAIRVTEEFDGELPADYELLVSLPGIGSYTAGAIASIAYGLPEPAVDGNVMRVLMRFLDRDDDVMSQRVRREVEELLREVMRDVVATGDFTQALMELGEVVCIPNGEPLCDACPLKELCRGRASGRASELPVRKAKTKRRIEKRTIFVIRDSAGNVLIRKRPDTGLLAGLWELPSVDGHLKKAEVEAAVSGIADGDCEAIQRLPAARHIFSHVEWDMIAYEVRVTPHHIVGATWANPHDLDAKFALPTAFSAYRLHE